MCDDFIKIIQSHLASGFESFKINEKCLIVTPFRYPDFASIEYSVKAINDKFLLSDDGETLNMLFVNGLTIENNKDLSNQIRRIAKSHKVEFNNSEISIISDQDDLGNASSNLINAIQAIGFILYKRRNITFDTFDDEVEKLLISNEVKYDSPFDVSGEAIYHHKIKFHINTNKNLLIEPITANSMQSARTKAIKTAFKWFDIEKVNQKYQFITVIDDRDKKWEEIWIDEEARKTVYTYSSKVFRWIEEQSKFLELIK